MEALEQQVFSLLLKHQGGTEYYDQFMYLESCDKKLTFEQVLSTITRHYDDFFSYYHQVLTNMMREYLIRFDCDVSKFPFRKKLYSCRDVYDTIKSSVMRAFMFGDSNAKTFYQSNGKKFNKFFKFASNIRKLCFHNYLKGKLNVDWIGCLPFLNEIEEMFRIIGCKFSNNFNFSNFLIDNEKKSESNLEAVLFCKRLNLFIVEFDGSDNERNIEKLKQLYLTQISLQYVNNSSTFSIILDGKKAIVHIGEFIESFRFYNFACIDHFYTYDLENMMDVIDLSFEIWKYCEKKLTKRGNPMVQRDYEKEHKQDINKEVNANKIKKERKENVLSNKHNTSNIEKYPILDAYTSELKSMVQTKSLTTWIQEAQNVNAMFWESPEANPELIEEFHSYCDEHFGITCVLKKEVAKSQYPEESFHSPEKKRKGRNKKPETIEQAVMALRNMLDSFTEDFNFRIGNMKTVSDLKIENNLIREEVMFSIKEINSVMETEDEFIQTRLKFFRPMMPRAEFQLTNNKAVAGYSTRPDFAEIVINLIIEIFSKTYQHERLSKCYFITTKL